MSLDRTPAGVGEGRLIWRWLEATVENGEELGTVKRDVFRDQARRAQPSYGKEAETRGET